jgi:hypothetical protein
VSGGIKKRKVVNGKGVIKMDRAEKVMLILKSIFKDNEDIINKIDAIAQLKRPEILLSHEEKVSFEEFAEEWYNKGWIIWTGKKSTEEDE